MGAAERPLRARRRHGRDAAVASQGGAPARHTARTAARAVPDPAAAGAGMAGRRRPGDERRRRARARARRGPPGAGRRSQRRPGRTERIMTGEPIADRRARLARAAAAAAGRAAGALGREVAREPAPGDLFVLPEAAAFAVEWLVIERAAEDRERLLVVPAD